jgi:hypothetical protein
VLFERRLQQGLSDGTISVAFRRWRRPQVVSGRRYRSPIGLVEVDAVSVVRGKPTPADAVSAGYSSVSELLNDLKGPSEPVLLYRVELHRVDDADPRDALSAQARLDESDLADLQQKLARLDNARAWTTATLRAIDEQPGTRAGDLAVQLGWPELHDFKLHVRKLKALGLTISLEVGYRLSPRGQAYLAALGSPNE